MLLYGKKMSLSIPIKDKPRAFISNASTSYVSGRISSAAEVRVRTVSALNKT